LEEYLTTNQLADRLQVSPATLRYWRHKRTGPPGVKFGKVVRYSLAEVEAWLAEQARRDGERR